MIKPRIVAAIANGAQDEPTPDRPRKKRDKRRPRRSSRIRKRVINRRSATASDASAIESQLSANPDSRIRIQAVSGEHAECWGALEEALGEEARLDIYKVATDNNPEQPGTDVTSHIEIVVEFVT